MKKTFVFLPTLIFCAFSAHAATYTWDGTNNNWNTAHWDAGAGLVSPNNAHANSFTISSGVVTFSGNDTFGQSGITSSPAITINTGGTLQSANTFTTIWNLNLAGGTLLANGGANGTFPAFRLAGTLSVTGDSASAINVGSGSNNMINIGGTGNGTLTLDVADVTSSSAADLTINTVLKEQGVIGSLTKTGLGTVTLSAANTYTGVTTIDNGVLSVGTIGNGGEAGNLGQATATATNLVFDGGTLQYTGANATSDRAFTINAGKTATIDTTNDISFAGATGTTTTGALTKTGGGTLTLTGASTHTGATTVSAGTLALTNNSALQSSALNTSGAGSVTLGTGITTPTLGGLTGSTNLSSVITGNYSLVTALTLNPGVGQTHTYSGNITDGATGMTLTKTGAGTQVLAGTNTHTGRTTISAGTLALSGGNDRLATTGAITIGASGTLDLDGNTQTTTGVVTLASGATLKGGTLTSNNTAIAGNNAITGTLNLGASGAFVTNRRLLIALGGTGSLTIGTGSTGSITFGGDNSNLRNYVGVDGGNGTLNINGGTANFNNASTGTGNGYLNVGSNSNTSAGSIVVNGGNMNVGTLLKLGGRFNNGFGTNATSSLAITTGTVTVGGGSDASFNGVLFMNGGAGDNTANTGTSTLTLNSGGVLNVKQIQAGNGGTKTINFDGGTLRAGASGTTFLNAATGLTVNVKDGGASIDTQASDITVAAALVANGTGGLTKSGGGALTLSGVNTYTGATLISGGTLKLDATGTVNNTSEVSLGTVGTFDVSDKGPGGYTVGTLKGSGNVTGALTVSTQLAIGNSPGTINFSSNLTMGAASTYLYEVNSGVTLGLNSADLGDIAGALNISAGSMLDLVQVGTYTVGNKFTLFAYDGLLTGIFKDTSSNDLADGATFTDAGGIWMIDYNDTSPGANGGVSASNTYVTITAVPEPSTMTLAGLLLTVGLLRRRRN